MGKRYRARRVSKRKKRKLLRVQRTFLRDKKFGLVSGHPVANRFADKLVTKIVYSCAFTLGKDENTSYTSTGPDTNMAMCFTMNDVNNLGCVSTAAKKATTNSSGFQWTYNQGNAAKQALTMDLSNQDEVSTALSVDVPVGVGIPVRSDQAQGAAAAPTGIVSGGQHELHTEFSDRYRYFRVTGFKLTLTLKNERDTPIWVYFVPKLGAAYGGAIDATQRQANVTSACTVHNPGYYDHHPGTQTPMFKRYIAGNEAGVRAKPHTISKYYGIKDLIMLHGEHGQNISTNVASLWAHSDGSRSWSTDLNESAPETQKYPHYVAMMNVLFKGGVGTGEITDGDPTLANYNASLSPPRVSGYYKCTYYGYYWEHKLSGVEDQGVQA